MHTRLTQETPRQALKKLQEAFDRLIQQPQGTAGLFTHHRNALMAQAQSQRFEDELQVISQQYAQRLKSLVDVSQATNDQVQQQTQIAVSHAHRNLLLLLLTGLALGVGAGWLFVISLTHPLHNAIDMAEKMADGDFAVRADVLTQDEIGQTMKALNEMATRVAAALGRVRDSTSCLAQVAERGSTMTAITQQDMQVERQATQETTIAIAQMLASANEVSQSAEASRDVAERVRGDVQLGQQIVTDTVSAINTLSNQVGNTAQVVGALAHHSETIGTALEVIRSIAEQTNLLALNAAIEAARAGDQGLGFAVVANEVRTLASRTHESTAEIQRMIKQMRDNAEKSLTAMEMSRKHAEISVLQATKAGTAFDNIIRSTHQIADMIARIATASTEQTQAAENVHHNMLNIARITEQTSHNTDEMVNLSHRTDQEARQLSEMVAHFRVR